MKNVVILDLKDYELLKKYEYVVKNSLQYATAYMSDENCVDIDIRKPFKDVFPDEYKKISQRAVNEYEERMREIRGQNGGE